MTEVFIDTGLDSVKLLPFLFLTYWIMEYIEHKTGDKTRKFLQKSGKWGPIFGSLAGLLPQCGFSAAASNLYAGRIVSMGTLIAIYLSTSDEMLPVLISESADTALIVKILAIKLIIGLAAGFCIDFCSRACNGAKKVQADIHSLCEHEHCHCEKSIFRSALHHTAQIFFFLVVVSLALNLVLFWKGEEVLAGLLLNRPVIGQLLAGMVGLIPNCAASVVITQLYMQGAMSFGAMMSGLLVGAGVGILVLCRVNHNKKENLKIIGLLYGIGVAAGIVIELAGMAG